LAFFVDLFASRENLRPSDFAAPLSPIIEPKIDPVRNTRKYREAKLPKPVIYVPVSPSTIFCREKTRTMSADKGATKIGGMPL